jgi:hypothetical protein
VCAAAVPLLILAGAGSAGAAEGRPEPAQAPAQTLAQAQPSATFDIPPQPLSRALTAFGRPSG